MPRKYKRKEGARPRTPVNENNLKLAVQDVLNGKSIRGTAKCYNISVMTLKRYVTKKQDALQQNTNQDIKYAPNYRKAQILTPVEEENLKNYLETASKLFYGLSPINVRQLTYQYVLVNGIIFPPKWHEMEAATCDWFYGFMNRHKNFSLGVPERASAPAFNRHNVGDFFNNLKTLMMRYEFRPDQIWNIDETGLTTVQIPSDIVPYERLKQVSKVKLGEKREQVTVCGAINALGNHLPPFMIIPRKNWQSRMTGGGPPGTEGAAHLSGWMTGPNFLKFLKFFVKHVKCSKENRCLIILDNNESHITINSINFAKENGIYLLTIPPYTSQKLQPLDRMLFVTLKTYYNFACDDWIKSHPGRPMTIYDIPGFLGKAYPSAMTPSNIQKSFEITGICPLNSEIFTDDDFLDSVVTKRENSDNKLAETIIANVDVYISPSPSTSLTSDPSKIKIDITDVPVVPSSSNTIKNDPTEPNTTTADVPFALFSGYDPAETNIANIDVYVSQFPSISPANDPSEIKIDITDVPVVPSSSTAINSDPTEPNTTTADVPVALFSGNHPTETNIAFASTSRHSFAMPSGSKLQNFKHIRTYPMAPSRRTSEGKLKGSTNILTHIPEKKAEGY